VCDGFRAACRKSTTWPGRQRAPFAVASANDLNPAACEQPAMRQLNACRNSQQREITRMKTSLSAAHWRRSTGMGPRRQRRGLHSNKTILGSTASPQVAMSSRHRRRHHRVSVYRNTFTYSPLAGRRLPGPVRSHLPAPMDDTRGSSSAVCDGRTRCIYVRAAPLYDTYAYAPVRYRTIPRSRHPCSDRCRLAFGERDFQQAGPTRGLSHHGGRQPRRPHLTPAPGRERHSQECL